MTRLLFLLITVSLSQALSAQPANYELALTRFQTDYNGALGDLHKTNSPSTPKNVVITGQITNRPISAPQTITIIIKDVASGQPIRLLDEIDEQGMFEFRFQRYYSQEVMLKYLSIWSVFTQPGDSIHILIDTEKLTSNETNYKALKFSGDAVKENEQLSLLEAWFSPIRIKDSQSRVPESRLTPEAYIQYRDSLRQTYHRQAMSICMSEQILNPIKRWIHYEIENNYFHHLSFYPSLHHRLNPELQNWSVPLSYYKSFSEVKLTPDFVINSDFASSFLDNFHPYIRASIEHKLDLQGQTRDTVFSNGEKGKIWLATNIDSLYIDAINALSPSGIKQFMLNYFFVFKQIHYSDTETYEKYLPLINEEVTEAYLLANLQTNYIRNKELKGELVTQRIKFVKTEDNQQSSILKQILSTNKGKVIYIDCWTTWCAPCLAEMPNSRKLMAELKDENIEFVYLCCSSPADDAKRKIEELKLEGTHYILDYDQTNCIQQELSFFTFPNYVLIDKKGKIVTSGTEYRPAAKLTRKKLFDLVAE